MDFMDLDLKLLSVVFPGEHHETKQTKWIFPNTRNLDNAPTTVAHPCSFILNLSDVGNKRHSMI